MTKDEIYERLAQVYLGKRERVQEKKPPLIDIKFFLNIVLTLVVLVFVFYGLSAFLPKKSPDSEKSVIFALNNSPIRIKYNLNYPYPQLSGFAIPIPKLNASKYNQLTFSIRGMEEGFPGVVKVVLKNRKNETSFYFIKGVELKWEKVVIPLSEFNKISDWTNLSELSFVFEAWNAEKKKGIVLIDDICFSNESITYGQPTEGRRNVSYLAELALDIF